MEMLSYEAFAGMFGLWAEKFRPFIESKEMFEIYQTLKSDAQRGAIVPCSDQVFRAFTKTIPDKVRSIWYLMDPYPKRYRNGKNQATGIAMDCSNSPDGVLQPSLKLFYDAMREDTGEDIKYSPSLDYLAEQGIMLLNTDLTCKINNTGSHAGLWYSFQKFFLEEVMKDRKDIMYVLAGKLSLTMLPLIQRMGNEIITLEHPAAASRQERAWEHCKVFSRLDKFIREKYNEQIYWDKQRYDDANEPPF